MRQCCLDLYIHTASLRGVIPVYDGEEIFGRVSGGRVRDYAVIRFLGDVELCPLIGWRGGVLFNLIWTNQRTVFLKKTCIVIICYCFK